MILAAGRGSRLDGLAAPWWKPLTIVNGEPLVRTLAEQACASVKGSVVLVVSPENTQPICQLMDEATLDQIEVVVQTQPKGPGDALLCAAPSLHSKRVLQLCADNVTPQRDLETMISESKGHDLTVGIRLIEDIDQASRFTVIDEGGLFHENRLRTMAVWKDRLYRAWLGPVIASTGRLIEAVRDLKPVGNEKKIGPALTQVGTPHLVEVDCYDIGSPGVWRSPEL